MSDYIDIVFDGPPGPTSGRFVEVEDPSGASVDAGNWVCRADGYWVLRITPEVLPAAQGCVVIEEADLVPHVHPQYGSGVFCTEDCINKMRPPGPNCATCNGNGMIGGPSYYAPDEGGDPCPDCSSSEQPTERERFEAWLDETSGFSNDDEGVAWAAWKAALAKDTP
jgi:hypothetical protein